MQYLLRTWGYCDMFYHMPLKQSIQIDYARVTTL